MLGPGSVEAARVASAARKQLPGDEFWQFHTKLLGDARSDRQGRGARGRQGARASTWTSSPRTWRTRTIEDRPARSDGDGRLAADQRHAELRRRRRGRRRRGRLRPAARTRSTPFTSAVTPPADETRIAVCARASTAGARPPRSLFLSCASVDIDRFQAIVMAVLQGVTELFPISSLGHAVILPRLLHWPIDQKAPDFLPYLVVMHLGTAIALFVFFWRDWLAFLQLARRPAARARRRRPADFPPRRAGDDPRRHRRLRAGKAARRRVRLAADRRLLPHRQRLHALSSATRSPAKASACSTSSIGRARSPSASPSASR